MNFDELKQEWKEMNPGNGNIGPKELLEYVQERGRAFDLEMRKRTWIGAAMFLLPLPLLVFLFGIFPGIRVETRIGGAAAGIFLLTCAFVVAWQGAFTRKRMSSAMSTREFIQQQLRKVDRQAWLFRNLKWWFWTPMLLAWLAYAVTVLAGRIDANLFSLFNVFLTPVLAYAGLRSTNRYLEREILPPQRDFREALGMLDGAR